VKRTPAAGVPKGTDYYLWPARGDRRRGERLGIEHRAERFSWAQLGKRLVVGFLIAAAFVLVARESRADTAAMYCSYVGSGGGDVWMYPKSTQVFDILEACQESNRLKAGAAACIFNAGPATTTDPVTVLASAATWSPSIALYCYDASGGSKGAGYPTFTRTTTTYQTLGSGTGPEQAIVVAAFLFAFFVGFRTGMA